MQTSLKWGSYRPLVSNAKCDLDPYALENLVQGMNGDRTSNLEGIRTRHVTSDCLLTFSLNLINIIKIKILFL